MSRDSQLLLGGMCKRLSIGAQIWIYRNQFTFGSKFNNLLRKSLRSKVYSSNSAKPDHNEMLWLNVWLWRIAVANR